MQIPYREIILPSLVKDVQDIFWDHINPHGLPANARTLRGVRIDKDNPAHQQMIGITEKYPFLAYHMLLFVLSPGGATLLHKDGVDENHNRQRSCNIPVSGCSENGVTEFYKANRNDFFVDVANATRFIKPRSQTTKIYEYALVDNPILCDTQLPHRVTNEKSKETRISVSWTTRREWTWDMIADYVEKTY